MREHRNATRGKCPSVKREGVKEGEQCKASSWYTRHVPRRRLVSLPFPEGMGAIAHASALGGAAKPPRAATIVT